MSGYFARLAAQVAAPTTSASNPRVGVSASPSAIEQHAEVASPARPTALPGEQPSMQTNPPSVEPRLAQALPVAAERPRETAPSRPRAEALVDSPSSLALTTPVDSGMADTGPTRAHEGLEEQSNRAILAPMAYQPEPFPSSNATPAHREPASAPGTGPSLRESRPSPDMAKQPGLSSVTLETSDRATGPSPHAVMPSDPRDLPFSVRPVEVHQVVEAQRSPRPPHAPEAMPRTHISIGTITLEVRAAASATIATPATQAVAEPAPAPARFSLRRHHVRWS